jgi:hypothetical protein
VYTASFRRKLSQGRISYDAPYRRTARHVSLREKYNRSCIGLDQWRRLGKFRHVCCMMSGVKCSRGGLKLKIPIRCPDRSSVNGKWLQEPHIFFLVAIDSNIFRLCRFKLFLEPHALRDQSAVDPRLPPLPVRKRVPTIA